MWNKLSHENRNQYKKLITNFSSLSEAFAQKEEGEDTIVAPIVNSKFQETAFQRCFNAYAEDIANTSYDASINDGENKYLVGIKTFGLRSGDQKIAQFKSIASTSEWSELITEIRHNAEGLTSKEKINEANRDLYISLATKIANVRNERIKSSEENLRGFELHDGTVEAVYHVLMPSPKNTTPEIFVGETDYKPIDIDNITIIGCTSAKNPQNFTFTDGIHEYKWTSADSQLSMKFHNPDIVLETWPVNYVDDAFSFFENMNHQVPTRPESYAWKIEVKPFSGFNAFYGQSKMSRQNNCRENWIESLIEKYEDQLRPLELQTIRNSLEELLLRHWNTTAEKIQMATIRNEFVDYLDSLNNEKLSKDIKTKIYRPSNEFELRIPNSRKFHLQHPGFFTDRTILNPDSKRCIGTKDERTFKLRFMPSANEVNAYITEDNGKAIESIGSQGILGEWVYRNVLQLAPYEVLTDKKLAEVGINGVRLTKRDGAIDLSFIWIDDNNKPDDYWK